MYILPLQTIFRFKKRKEKKKDWNDFITPTAQTPKIIHIKVFLKEYKVLVNTPKPFA